MDETFILMSLGTTAAAIVGYLIIRLLVRTPGISLNNKFRSLGVLQGKTYGEIAQKCGSANATSAKVLDDGSIVKIRQWISTGYHIVLLFDENDICLGVSSEIGV